MSELCWCYLGPVEYAAARGLQTHLAERRASDAIGDTLLLLEHPAIYTVGRNAPWPELPAGPRAPVVRTDRGGDVTYHGPGQLVGYPVCSIRGRGVRSFVASLEEALCDVARALGVDASARCGFPGVWVEGAGGARKLASIGLSVRRGVTLHGFALNVDRRAEAGFADVAPCGLAGVRATSLEAAVGAVPADLERLAPLVAAALAARLGARRALPVEIDALGAREAADLVP